MNPPQVYMCSPSWILLPPPSPYHPSGSFTFFITVSGWVVGFPGGASDKEPSANAGDARDVDSIPGWGRSPGGGLGHPVQYSCLENPMDRGAWWATVHSVAKSRLGLKQLSMQHRWVVKSNTSYLSMNGTGLFTPTLLFSKEKEEGHLITAAVYQLHSQRMMHYIIQIRKTQIMLDYIHDYSYYYIKTLCWKQ